MNKVITINLRGTAYQLEEGGYDALRAYLESATTRLQGNPDLAEILSDIEWAIAEKFRALLGRHKTVVETREAEAVLAEMGPIETAPGEATGPGAGAPGTPGGASGPGATPGKGPPTGGGTPKRFYRIREGDMIAGVCNGIAAYFQVDPTLVRLGFVFLAIFWGTGVLAYLIMAIVVPEANTPEEKAAATGDPATAQEFIRRAKAGYYEAMKGFPDRQARREWRRRFKREMRAHAHRWRYHWPGWRSYWAGCGEEAGPIHPGLGLALPLLSLMHGVAKILLICALISLLASGAVFGLALPANVPVWGAVLLLLLGYGLFAGPVKMARRACGWGLGRPGPVWALVFFLDAVVWLAVAVFLLWLACHHFPELREAVRSLPALLHQAADDVRTWWQGK